MPVTPVQLVVLLAIAVVALKVVTSLFGRRDLPILNVAVFGILFAFVGFEVFQLGKALLLRFGAS